MSCRLAFAVSAALDVAIDDANHVHHIRVRPRRAVHLIPKAGVRVLCAFHIRRHGRQRSFAFSHGRDFQMRSPKKTDEWQAVRYITAIKAFEAADLAARKIDCRGSFDGAHFSSPQSLLEQGARRPLPRRALPSRASRPGVASSFRGLPLRLAETLPSPTRRPPLPAHSPLLPAATVEFSCVGFAHVKIQDGLTVIVEPHKSSAANLQADRH
jgi:hypothetical protein